MTPLPDRPTIVLLVEREADAPDRLHDALGTLASGRIEVVRAGRLSDGLERLSRGGVDAVLLDLHLPDADGLETFERAHAFAPDVPIVVLTERPDEAKALATVQGGAQDHLVRAEITPDLLDRALRYAMERHRLLSALRRLSLIDDLTGLFNRDGFDEVGAQYLDLARRSRRETAVVHLDVDRFRTINEALGHHVGDRALLRVAEVLRSTFRCSDVLARTGADHFAVLAMDTSGAQADGLRRRIRDALDAFNDSGLEPFRLSVSVGIARSDGEQAHLSLRELLERAEHRTTEGRGSRGWVTA